MLDTATTGGQHRGDESTTKSHSEVNAKFTNGRNLKPGLDQRPRSVKTQPPMSDPKTPQRKPTGRLTNDPIMDPLFFSSRAAAQPNECAKRMTKWGVGLYLMEIPPVHDKAKQKKNSSSAGTSHQHFSVPLSAGPSRISWGIHSDQVQRLLTEARKVEQRGGV